MSAEQGRVGRGFVGRRVLRRTRGWSGSREGHGEQPAAGTGEGVRDVVALLRGRGGFELLAGLGAVGHGCWLGNGSRET